MRVSKEQASENRKAIVGAASRLFRERGVDGVGVADLMKEAGFTHGGFYNHFPSKEALAAEACAAAFDGSIGQLAAAVEAPGGGAAFASFLENYLSPEHRDDPVGACPIASLPIDAWRHGELVQGAYAAGVGAFIDLVAAQLAKKPSGKRAGAGVVRERALRLVSEMVGALVLARAVSEASPDLSDAILAASRDNLGA